jgi:hypothetical protein
MAWKLYLWDLSLLRLRSFESIIIRFLFKVFILSFTLTLFRLVSVYLSPRAHWRSSNAQDLRGIRFDFCWIVGYPDCFRNVIATRNCEDAPIRFAISACCMHVTTREQMNWLFINLILSSFTKLKLSTNSSFGQTGAKIMDTLHKDLYSFMCVSESQLATEYLSE